MSSVSKVNLADEEVTLTFGKSKEKQKSTLFYSIIVLVAVSCGVGIGIGVGYSIWYGDVPAKATAEPQKPGDKTTLVPKPPSTAKPEATTAKAGDGTTSHGGTSAPGKPWLETPCFTQQQPQCPEGVDKPPLILVSLDGFRNDYLDRGVTPNLKRLSDCGVHTPYMYPSFPTLTFPNHYSIVTGLLPEHHGIIGNNMYDPVLNKVFSLSGTEKDNSYWWGGEPIWNTAMKQGLIAGSYFWVGSDVDIQGMRPDYYYPYDGNTLPETKINKIKEWLQYPSATRPDFITLYFDEPDHTGHDFGPNSDTTNAMLTTVDSYIRDLMDAITEIQMENCTNIIILADHGMSNRSCDLNIVLSEFINTGDYYSRSSGGTMMRYDSKSTAEISEPEDIVEHLKCISPASVAYVKSDTPKRWHYMNSVRIEDTLIAVDQTYTISNGKSGGCAGGGHGYDNVKSDHMRAMFLAYGPSFKGNYEVEPFHNIELMNLMCDVIGITPPPNDGEDGSLHHMLRDLPTLPPRDDTNVSMSLKCPFPSSGQEYDDRISADVSMCMCDTLPDGTVKSIADFDEQLNLTDSQKSASHMKHAPFGMPQVNFKTDFCELTQNDYVTAYSHELRMPLYATFTMEQNSGTGVAPVFSNCSRPDVRIPSAKTPNCNDYDMSTGEMANMTNGYLYSPGLTSSLDAKMDSLITSNMVPQFSGFIKDLWSGVLDIHLPLWANEYNGINVVTGPIFDYDFDGLRDPMDVLNTHGSKLEDTFVPDPFLCCD